MILKETSNYKCISLYGKPSFIVVFIFLMAVTFSQTIPKMPMGYNYEHTLEYEWSQKEVLDSKLLCDMESMDRWEHKGFGTLSLSGEKVFKGSSSLLLTSPTKGENLTSGRPWGASSAMFKMENQDMTPWNRVTFWVYPDLPGFRVVSLSLVFHNDGEEKVPGPHNRNGLNYQILNNQEWNQVYWEVEHLGRDKVTALELRYRLQGNEPEATETVKFYFDELYLEKVEPDHYEGWNVAPGHIAYNHIGYAVDFPKRALASDLSASTFSLVNLNTNRTVIEKPIINEKTPTGLFQVMDFSEINMPGEFILKAGGIETRPFKINKFHDIYRSTIIKTINHFYAQRCGTEIEGIHSACHGDWTCTHGDKTIVINGGWHDAGDLSQGKVNTSEAAFAMLDLAINIRYYDPQLYERLLEEAKWGLEYMLKTRFGDGYRVVWATMDFWTDGIMGTIDDVPAEARNNPQANFLSAKTEALAGILFMDKDPIFARYALRCAEEDFDFAVEGARNMDVALAGTALNAAIVLYEATHDVKYKDAAIAYGDFIMQCQLTTNLARNIPYKGFFYREPAKENILRYSHRSHEQDPVVGLVNLCEYFPEHANRTKWETALKMYADFYKDISGTTAPYYMIPAGIYDLEAASSEEDIEQIKNGYRLSNRYYLKSFPIWGAFRGNSGTILSQAKGLSAIGRYLDDKDLMVLSKKQIEWHLGINPFNQSLMYGEGYRYAGQYSAMSGNLVGGLPVGVQTHFNRDLPYWPAENCYNWKEIWVHPSSRWLWIMSDFYK